MHRVGAVKNLTRHLQNIACIQKWIPVSHVVFKIKSTEKHTTIYDKVKPGIRQNTTVPYITYTVLLAHLSKSSGWAIVITLCPSSVVVRRSSSTISLLTLKRSQFSPNLDETCSECLPLWTLGQVRYWVTWGKKPRSPGQIKGQAC